MRLLDITELSIVTIFDRGVPNKECVAISVNERCNLGQYALIAGMRAPEEMAYPMRDTFLWFGDTEVNPGDWIFIYTGPGSSQITASPNSSNKTFTAHWGRKSTIFTTPQMLALLMRVDAVCLGPPADAVPTATPTQIR